jgi:YhcH/YjgK/YiaL family protein
VILDTLGNFRVYEPIHPNLPLAFNFLRAANNAIADGRHVITGDSVYANVMSYVTKPAMDGTHEVHRRYVDVQFLLSGEEIIRYTPRERLGAWHRLCERKGLRAFPRAGRSRGVGTARRTGRDFPARRGA